MKPLKLLLPILIITISLFSCGENHVQEDSEIGKMLRGKHELRKFKTVTEEGYRMSGSYFLIAGSVSGGTYKNNKVAFSFQLPDSSYAMAELNFGDIRVKIDSTITKPYVTFNWDKGKNANDINFVMDYHVNYMVVHCREEDFPYEVNITNL